MYEPRYGAKHQGYLPAAEIARRVRADIKQAVADGALPSDLEYRVRSETYSGGQSVRVVAIGLSDERQYTHVADHHELPSRQYTAEARVLRGTLERLVQAYNRDASDPMTDYYDVMYHGFAEIEDEWGRRSREREAARQKAMREARKARQAVA